MPPKKINPLSDNPNAYFLPLDDTELSRLILQDRIITPQMGSLLPHEVEEEAKHILDVACGPAGWMLDVAATHPQVDITGIDISAKMLAYAESQRQVRGLSNVHFQIMDARDLSSLPDESFDFVNVRLIQAFMRESDWPVLIQECERITRPGGWLRLCEGEAPFTNSVALDTLYDLILRMMWKRGLIYSPTGRHGGVLYLLDNLLWQGGWSDIRREMYAIDISAKAPARDMAYEDHKIGLSSIKAFLIGAQAKPQEEIEQLVQQALDDFRSPGFWGAWAFISAWGRKSS